MREKPEWLARRERDRSLRKDPGDIGIAVRAAHRATNAMIASEQAGAQGRDRSCAKHHDESLAASKEFMDAMFRLRAENRRLVEAIEARTCPRRWTQSSFGFVGEAMRVSECRATTTADQQNGCWACRVLASLSDREESRG